MSHPKQLLDQYGLHPKKSLGQNFLFDPNVLHRLVASADLAPTDRVLEVGPGLGHLTQLLLQSAAQVTAVELDSRFLPILQSRFRSAANLQLVQADILTLNPAHYFKHSYIVVANVPYYITGSILRHLLSSSPKPFRMVLTVQKEVAQRLTAVPPQMSLLSVTTQFYGQARLVTTIKAGAFWPRPDVDSAVVRLDVNQDRPVPINKETQFMNLVRAGFSQKRKQLKNNLKQLGLKGDTLTAVFAQASVDPACRAQTLTLDDWVRLYQAVSGTEIELKD